MELQVSKNTFDMAVVRSLAATGWVPLILDWTVGCVGTPLESVMGDALGMNAGGVARASTRDGVRNMVRKVAAAATNIFAQDEFA